MTRRVCLLAMLTMLCARVAASGDGDERAARIKSAFLVNIARFVEWPADSARGKADEVVFCIWREAAQAIDLSAMRDKRIGRRSLRVRRLDALGDLDDCHALFVPASRLRQFHSQASAERRQGLLVVTDLTTEGADERLSPGVAMIALVREGARIGIDIDLAAARAAGLRISSELLKLARLVGD